MKNIFSDYLDGPDEPEENGSDEYEGYSLSEQKTKEEVRKLQITNEALINNLVLKSMVKSVLGQIGQELKTAFVDMPRRESGTVAAKLGIPEKEKELERLWSEINQKALDSMKSAVAAMQKDEIWE